MLVNWCPRVTASSSARRSPPPPVLPVARKKQTASPPSLKESSPPLPRRKGLLHPRDEFNHPQLVRSSLAARPWSSRTAGVEGVQCVVVQ